MIDLKSAREAKGMTQEDLAQACGVIRQTISAIEVGQNKPRPELAKKIGEILDVQWWELYGDS